MAQGYQDIALNTLDMLEQQFGAHAEIAGRRAKLASLPPESAVSIEFPVEAPVFQAPNAKSAAFNSPPTLTARAPQPDVQAAPARPNIDPGLAAIFDEFRTAVEEEDAPVDGDFETHYNLGLAYKEMELLDEAVEAFQVAASLVAPRDGTPRYLQCCNLLGHIFIKKQMGRLAVMWLQHGLDAPGHTEDEYQALRYEMGLAHEQMGDLDKAIDVFSEVYGVNVSYRGVADKLRELQSLKTINQVPSS
jgi:tetratricopeptide (TPR) repeat protein